MIPKLNGLSSVERYQRHIVAYFFIGVLFLGASVYNDFGVSCDASARIQHGVNAYAYVFENNPRLLFIKTNHSGPIIELLFETLRRFFGVKTIRGYLLLRHFFTFLIFLGGVYFFYKLSLYLFSNWKIALFGSLCLVLSPRLFGHAFFNTKDIPFFSLFIICMYTLFRFLDRKDISMGAIHGFCCGLLMNVRIVGILVPLFTLIFLIQDCFGGIRMRVRKPY